MSQYDDGQIRHWPCVRNGQEKINKEKIKRKQKEKNVGVR